MRGTVPFAPALAVLLLLLLAACGFLAEDPIIVRTSVTAPPVDGVRITEMAVFSGRHPPCPDPVDPVSSVPAGDPGIWAAYEVTNDGIEAFTYTIRFAFTTDMRESVTSRSETLRSLGPGATARGTVRLGRLDPATCPVTGIKGRRGDQAALLRGAARARGMPTLRSPSHCG